MKLSEAIEFMQNIELAVVKARSNVMETLGVEDADEDTPAMRIAVELNPYLFGPKSVLTAAVASTRLARKSGKIDPLNLMNLLVLVQHERLIEVAYIGRTGKPFPEWRVENFRHWDDEGELVRLTEDPMLNREMWGHIKGSSAGFGKLFDADSRIEKAKRNLEKSNEELRRSLEMITDQSKKLLEIVITLVERENQRSDTFNLTREDFERVLSYLGELNATDAGENDDADKFYDYLRDEYGHKWS